MRSGQLVGGKIATPIREMLSSPLYNGVIFHCGSRERAEATRDAALVLKHRNKYDYRTKRNGNDMIVYVGGIDDDIEGFDVDNLNA